MRKRLTVILITLLMALSLVPMASFAENAALPAADIFDYNAASPNHECVPGKDWCWMDDYDYHFRVCKICGEIVGEVYPHTTEIYWTARSYVDPETGVETELGHCLTCTICGAPISEIEPHDFKDNYCAVCGIMDPNHECVPEEPWYWKKGYDSHFKTCEICGKTLNEEPHTYQNGYCTVCGCPEPNHECMPGRIWHWNEYNPGYHYKECNICGKIVETEAHTYVNKICTVCGAPGPNHECVDSHWSAWSYVDEETGRQVELGHCLSCVICDSQMSDFEPHQFVGDYCTVCGYEKPDCEQQNPDLYDIDGNGFVDEDDLTLLLRHVAKIAEVKDADILEKMDFNHDDSVDAGDITWLAKYLASKASENN